MVPKKFYKYIFIIYNYIMDPKKKYNILLEYIVFYILDNFLT